MNSNAQRAPNRLDRLLRRAFTGCDGQARRSAARVTASSALLLTPSVPVSLRNCASRNGAQAIRRSQQHRAVASKRRLLLLSRCEEGRSELHDVIEELLLELLRDLSALADLLEDVRRVAVEVREELALE